MPIGLTPLSFDGHSIQDATYLTTFDSEFEDVLHATANANELPGAPAVFAFSQPTNEPIHLKIAILDGTSQEKWDELLGWFQPSQDLKALVASDKNGVERTISCTVEHVRIRAAAQLFLIDLATFGKWRRVDAEETEDEVTASGQTIEIVNPGNVPAPMVITFTANDVSSTRQTKVRRVFVANRSEQSPLYDYAAEAYPIVIGTVDDYGGDEAKIAVYLTSEHIPHWVADDKVFVNLHCDPPLTAQLAEDIDSGDDELTVENILGMQGWLERGWFFIDSEVFQYAGRTLNTPGTLTRRWPTSHAAGATLFSIEHELRVAYDGPDETAPPSWDDTEPLIDLELSSDTKHIWNRARGFLSTATRRARGWLLPLTDDNEGHVRSFEGADGFTFQDNAPVAGKPPLNHIAMRFPVPMIGPLLLDYKVDQSMHLVCRVTDTEGYESELFSKFWTNGVARVAFPSIPLQKVEFIGRVAAVTGEVDTSDGVSPLVLTPYNRTADLENPLFDQVMSARDDFFQKIDDEIKKMRDWRLADGTGSNTGVGALPGITKHQSIDIPIRWYVHIALEQETKISGILLYLYGGGETFTIYDSEFRAVSSAVFGSGAVGERVALFDPPLVLPAGDYFLRSASGATTIGARSGHTRANIWYSELDVPKLRDQTLVFSDSESPSVTFTYDAFDVIEAETVTIDYSIDETTEVEIPHKDAYDIDYFNVTPIIAVLSAETEPQDDAPLESGLVAWVDNIEAPLDPDQTPKVWAAQEEDLFFLAGDVTNETTGRKVDLQHLLIVGESLELDSETLALTDMETELPAMYSESFDDINDFFNAKPGTNLLSVNIPGVQSLTVAISLYGRLN